MSIPLTIVVSRGARQIRWGIIGGQIALEIRRVAPSALPLTSFTRPGQGFVRQFDGSIGGWFLRSISV
jgi:hypothetical protein